jgi:hypothetical protein
MTDNLAGLGPQYEAAADRYSSHAANGLYNAHYDRPAGLELLGDVDGRHVLDAACGPGYYYAAELLRRGARRVLRPAGAVVLTCLHPTGNWLRHGGSYFDSGIVEEHWGGYLDMRVRFWVEPLEATCATIADAGFVIERLVEPRPRPEGAAVAPGLYEKLSTGPHGFLAFRLRPSADPGAPAAPDAAGAQSNQ